MDSNTTGMLFLWRYFDSYSMLIVSGAYSAYLAFQSVSGDNLGGSDGFNDGGECSMLL